MSNEQNKRIQGKAHKVRCPLTPDVQNIRCDARSGRYSDPLH